LEQAEVEVGAYLVAGPQSFELVEPGGWVDRAARCSPRASPFPHGLPPNRT
jgi:hypothetical protein